MVFLFLPASGPKMMFFNRPGWGARGPGTGPKSPWTQPKMAWLDAGKKIDDTTKGAKQIGVLRETTRACKIEVTTHSGIA